MSIPIHLHWTAALHHDGSSLYLLNPLPALGETVTVRLRGPVEAPIRAVFLRTAPDGENHLTQMREAKRDDLAVWWEAPLPVTMPYNPYRFKVLTPEGAYYVTGAGVNRFESPDYLDFKLLADFAAPLWALESVFYQIFPDRFFNGDPANDVPDSAWTIGHFATQRRPWGALPLPWRESGGLDFYGGDLSGIVQKLDYIRDLGGNALYLNPIFAARTNHRYDVRDFFNVDSHLGGNDALAVLRHALDSTGMHLVLDVTLNHCGWKHPWFVAAQADAAAPTAEYFTFHRHPDHYESWLGHRSLPKLNYRSEKLRDVLFRAPDSVLRRWLKDPYRVDGWRFDVANMQGRQGALQLGHKIGRQIRRAVKADNPQAYLFGEHFHDATPNLQGDELDATMNYQGFAIPVWRWLAGADQGMFGWAPESADRTLLPAEYLAEQWTRYRAAVPWVIARQQYNLLGSHDTARILTMLGGASVLVRLAAVMLFTYPGVPSIYYGDEIGMEGGSDPDNRRCMIWDESAWDHDLRRHFQKLARLRRSAPALVRGGFQSLYARDGLLAFQRQSEEQRLVVIGYRGPQDLAEAVIPVRHGAIRDGARFEDLLNGGAYTVAGGALRLTNLVRGSALILEQVEN